MAERKTKVVHQGQEYEAMDVPIKKVEESVATYELEDGTVLRMRTVLLNALRIDELRNKQGEPTYVVKSQNVVSANVADAHRKPVEE